MAQTIELPKTSPISRVEALVVTELANVSTDGGPFLRGIFNEVKEVDNPNNVSMWINTPSSVVGLSNKEYFLPRVTAHLLNAKKLYELPTLYFYRDTWIRKHSEEYTDQFFEYIGMHIRDANCQTSEYPPEFYALKVARGILSCMPKSEKFRNAKRLLNIVKTIDPTFSTQVLNQLHSVIVSEFPQMPANFLIKNFPFPYIAENPNPLNSADLYTRKQAQLLSAVIFYFTAPLYSEEKTFEKLLYEKDLFIYFQGLNFLQTLRQVAR